MSLNCPTGVTNGEQREREGDRTGAQHKALGVGARTCRTWKQWGLGGYCQGTQLWGPELSDLGRIPASLTGEERKLPSVGNASTQM